MIIVGYSLADATLIIGQDNEHAILFSNNQETGEVDGIIGAEEIELFVFVPNFFEPEVYETYTYDQLFGDFEGIYDNNFGGLYDDIYGPDETEYEDIYLDFDIGEPPVILV